MFVSIEPYILRQVLITACLNIGHILVGYTIYWTAPIIPKLQSYEETPLSRVISEAEASWVGSSTFLGACGSLIAGIASNYVGRRICVIVCGILVIISHLILTFPTTIATIYVGRVCAGSSVGMLVLVTIIYLGEIASPNIRGILISSTSVFHSLGGFLVYCVGPYVSYAGVGYVLFGISIFYVATSFFLPESPLYHVMKGNEEAAKESLRKLGRTKDIDTELNRMIEQVLQTKTGAYLWKELLTEKGNRKALYVTVPLHVFQQSSGILAVIFFATTIFRDAGSSIQPHIATMAVGATSLVSSIFAPMFIDRYGRRILLFVSTAGCCASMVVMGSYFYLAHIGDPSILWLGWLPLVCLVSALFFYGLGLTIIPNTIIGEMFSPAVRGLGSAIALGCGYISGLISTTIFGYIVMAVGSYATFWMFAAVNAIAFIFVITVVPETKGKTLIEIGNMMEE